MMTILVSSRNVERPELRAFRPHRQMAQDRSLARNLHLKRAPFFFSFSIAATQSGHVSNQNGSTPNKQAQLMMVRSNLFCSIRTDEGQRANQRACAPHVLHTINGAHARTLAQFITFKQGAFATPEEEKESRAAFLSASKGTGVCAAESSNYVSWREGEILLKAAKSNKSHC